MEESAIPPLTQPFIFCKDASALPPVASNGLGEHQARRTTGLRRASRQESASVVVSRWRHPNRRSAFQAVFSS